MSSHPRVFLSHAFEDQRRFVEPLANLLIERGIDPWYANWEITPGDSLPHKIFDQGLGKADTVVVVLSEVSVTKPWVEAELDLAVVRRIEEAVRLIPVKIGECEVPQSLRSTLYIDMQKEGSINRVAEKIDNAVRGVSSKPALGEPRAYAGLARFRLPGLDATDGAVLQLLYEALLQDEFDTVATEGVLQSAVAAGMTEDAFVEALELLSEQGYVVARGRFVGVSMYRIAQFPSATITQLASHNGIDVDALETKVAALILNDGVTDQGQIARKAGAPAVLIVAVLKTFQDQGFLRYHACQGGGGSVHSESATFKRWLRQR